MAEDKRDTGTRPVELVGESKELIAFALLRYLAQIEQGRDGVTFDRAWMLDAYAECLQAVEGKRRARGGTKANTAPRSKRSA